MARRRWLYCASSAPTRPFSLGAGTLLTNGVATSSLTAGNFTPATGKVAVRFSARIQATSVITIGVTLGGTAVTMRAQKLGMTTQAVGNTMVWIGTVTGVATGSPLSLVITSNKNLNRHVIMVNDIPAGWGGTVGGQNAVVNNTAVTSLAASATASGTNKLWIGTSNGLLNTAAPITPLEAAWDTNDGETDTGTGIDASNDAAFFQGTGPSTGGTMTLTGQFTGGTPNNEATALVELL